MARENLIPSCRPATVASDGNLSKESLSKQVIGRIKKASDDDLIIAYAELDSVSLVGQRFGMTGSSVHERLVRLGVDTNANIFTEEDCDRLRRDYEIYVSQGRLNDLAIEMGRTRNFLCRKAKSLGLTDISRPKDKIVLEKMNAGRKAHFDAFGHPKGMLGKKHTEATKNTISSKSKKYWDGMDSEQRSAFTLLQMKAKVEAHGSLAPNVVRGTWKAGWRDIGEVRKYYRSRWEANYARYLQWMKERGYITDWKHEPETFWFEAIKRGVRSYLPDFRVWEKDGSSRLHEVKGWMDSRSKTTLRRMAKYHPDQTIVLVDAKKYRAIARKVGSMIKGWE
jgi:hypothetical protein